MASTPIYNWPTPDNSDLVKNGALAMRTLGDAIDTTMATMTPKSIVDAKGDLIAASAADTPARLAVGANGETLVPDSSTATGLRWQQIENRNACYNSAFDIWQRGTSFAATGATNQYAADRWLIYRGVGGSTFSRQSAGSLGTTPAQIAQYCMRVARDSGNTATNEIYLMQTFENVDSNAYLGKTVVFSFYARKGANFSEANSYLTAAIVSGTGTDQNQLNFTGFAVVGNTNFTLTTSWQRFQLTVTIPTTVSQIGVRFFYTPVGTAGAADYFEVTATKLETGSIASTFNRQGGSIQGELAACQRYYFRTSNDSSFSRFAFGSCETTTTGSVQLMLPVTMRVAPTAVEWSNLRTTDLANDYGAPSSVTINTFLNTRNIAVFNVADTGWTAYRPLYLEANNNAAAHLAVTAEL